MSGLRRATPAKQILELTRRLAEDYDAIPLPDVSRVVQDAITTATARGEVWGPTDGSPGIVDVIKQLACEDLEGMRKDRGRRSAKVRPTPTAPRQRAARPNAPRQGAA